MQDVDHVETFAVNEGYEEEIDEENEGIFFDIKFLLLISCLY